MSADAFINVILLLFLSIIFNIKYNNKKIKNNEKIILFLLSITIALCKIVYLPFVFLLLLLINKNDNSQRKKTCIFIIITIIISGFFCYLWLRTTGKIFDISYPKSHLQKTFIIENVLEYLIICFRTCVNYAMVYVEELFVGSRMYHSQLIIPYVISYLYIILLSVTLLKEKIINNIILKEKILTIFVGATVFGLILTALYTQCTAQYFGIGYKTIEGIQGRYFIPLVMLIPFIIKPTGLKRIKIDDKKIIFTVLLFNLTVWMYMLVQFMI